MYHVRPDGRVKATAVNVSQNHDLKWKEQIRAVVMTDWHPAE